MISIEALKSKSRMLMNSKMEKSKQLEGVISKILENDNKNKENKVNDGLEQERLGSKILGSISIDK